MPRPIQRGAHGALVALAPLGRRRHVERIGRRAVPDHLGDRSRTARERVLELLEDEDGRSPPRRRSRRAWRRTGATPWPALYSPVSGSRGVPSARIWPKPAKASGTSGASVPRAEHDVGLAADDGLHRLADGVAAGRAGADDGHVVAAEAVL